MQFMFSANIALFLMSALILGGVMSSLVSRKFGVPLLLLFLVVGMLAGEDGPGGLHFTNYPVTYFIGSLALAIILFDGGLRLKMTDLKSCLAPAGLLASVGVVVATAIVAIVAHFGLHLGWPESLLIGAILASTDAAAVMLLTKSGGVRINHKLTHTLEVESGFNDPTAILLTITLVEFILKATGGFSGADLLPMLGSFVTEAAIGLAVGIGGGLALSWLLGRLRFTDSLNPLFILGGSVLIFSGAALLHGSSFLAVYLAGVVVGNRPLRNKDAIISFQDTLTILSQMVMFLALGLLVSPSNLLNYAVPSLLIAITLMFIARPAAVWLCLQPFKQYTPNEKTFISWVGLRGAVAIFLAAIPRLSNVPNADMYFNIAFFVVLVSLLTQGWTMPAMARYLKISK